MAAQCHRPGQYNSNAVIIVLTCAPGPFKRQVKNKERPKFWLPDRIPEEDLQHVRRCGRNQLRAPEC
jgi:hypothetical protein